MEMKDKKMLILGDSITEGSGVTDISNRFDNCLLREAKLREVKNYGVGGTRIAEQHTPSINKKYDRDFALRALEMDKEADIVVVFGGVNDYLHGDAPFGEFGDSTKDTFLGAVDNLCRILSSLYPSSTLVFFTPAHTYRDGDISLYKKENHMKNGKPLYKYNEGIKRIAPIYGFHVFDMMENLPIDPNSKEDYDKYTVDGLHLNDRGHKVIADVMKRAIESI